MNTLAQRLLYRYILPHALAFGMSARLKQNEAHVTAQVPWSHATHCFVPFVAFPASVSVHSLLHRVH